MAASNRPKTRVKKCNKAGGTRRAITPANGSNTGHRNQSGERPADHGALGALPGVETMTVAIAPGPATNGIADGTSATSPSSSGAASKPKSISSTTSNSSNPPATDRLPSDTPR